MNFITAFRIHRFQAVFLSITALLFTLFFDSYFAVLAEIIYAKFLYDTIIPLRSYIVHSGYSWHWGWLGRYVFVSPKAHYLHHSIQAEHQQKNLGRIFVIWDRLFGTWQDPRDIKVETIGIRTESGEREDISLLEDFFGRPFDFFKSAFASLQAFLARFRF